MLTSKQKSEWIAALRSGKFKQGRNKLFDECNNSYCCLGVLAKINGLDVSTELLTEEHHESIQLHDWSESFSYKGVNMGNFKTMNIERIRSYLSLGEANDNGVPFLEIADHLEKHLPTKD
jgi:hypothetical protein